MNSDQQTAAKASYDIGLLFPVLFLVGIGIVMVYSASSAVAFGFAFSAETTSTQSSACRW